MCENIHLRRGAMTLALFAPMLSSVFSFFCGPIIKLFRRDAVARLLRAARLALDLVFAAGFVWCLLHPPGAGGSAFLLSAATAAGVGP